MAENTFNWDESHRLQTLDLVYSKTIKKIEDDIKWYNEHARSKRNWAQALRVISLSFLGFGSVAPVIIDVTKSGVSPSIATLLIAAGTGLIQLDRYLGYSTGWVCYMTTRMILQAKLDDFQYAWEAERCKWAVTAPPIENARMMIGLCASFRSEVSTHVREETQIWAQEFQNNLKLLDENFKLMSERGRPGAVSIVVENYELYKGGWKLFVDGIEFGKYHSAQAANSSLTPGIRKIAVVVVDETDKEEFREEQAVTIKSDEIINLKFTLPSSKASAAAPESTKTA